MKCFFNNYSTTDYCPNTTTNSRIKMNSTAISTEDDYDVINSKLMLAYDNNKLIHLVVNDEKGNKKRLSNYDVSLNKESKNFMDEFNNRIMELRCNLVGECIRNEYDANNEKHYGVISVPKVNNPIQLVIQELPYYCDTKCMSYDNLLFTSWNAFKIITDQLLQDKTDMLSLNLFSVEDGDIYPPNTDFKYPKAKENFIVFDIGTKKIKSQLLIYTHNKYFVATLKQLLENEFYDFFTAFPNPSVFKNVFKHIMNVVSGKKSHSDVIRGFLDDIMNKKEKDNVIESFTKCLGIDFNTELEKEEIPREKTLSKKEKEKLKKQKAKEANKLREQEKKNKAKLAEQQAKQFEKQQKERERKRIETARKKKLALLKK